MNDHRRSVRVRCSPLFALATLLAATIVAAQSGGKPPASEELRRLLAETRAQADAQRQLLAEQQATVEGQREKLEAQAAALAEQEAKLASMQEQLEAMNRRIEEALQELPAQAGQQALEQRLKRVELASQKVPELPPSVVSAGDFPGSIRIPGTDAAIKLGGRIRTAAVFTLDPLGSTDRFLTNSIPMADTPPPPGEGKRTSFSANTSRFNFEVRTPTGAGQMRTFLEGDFFGSSGSEKRTDFRMRHAYAQFKGILLGQTWSTFSDPASNHQDLDFEGINGENVIRQPQIRYTRQLGSAWSLAVAAETPEVSLTGGQGVNISPDLVARAIWSFRETGHVQGALVLRQVRGESELTPGETQAVFGWGGSLSGVIPLRWLAASDRFIFQLNGGRGNARYINDLNSLGGQDGVFDPATGRLEVLRAVGWYVDYEHQWKHWATVRDMRLRSSFIWSFVTVDNLAFQSDDAYHQTNRFSGNLVFSPIPRIDIGVEYIGGRRENKNGESGTATQVQAVGIFRF